MDSSKAPSREPPVPLERWLRELQAEVAPPFLLGGTGHLVLAPNEERYVDRRLGQVVLPRILDLAAGRELLVLTGLAPGADHLFSRITLALLQRLRLPHRLVGLLPLPIDAMLEDWADKVRSQPDFTESRYEQQRQQMLKEVDACNLIIHLMPPGTTAESIADEGFRQLQYRRLAACLAEQTDALVAILRDGSTSQPGGTAEVVQWRREPQRVPAEITTLALRHSEAALHGALFVIAPEGDTGRG